MTLPRSRRQAETTTPESVTSLPVEDVPVVDAAAEAATTTVAPADEGEVLTVNHNFVPEFEFDELVFW